MATYFRDGDDLLTQITVGGSTLELERRGLDGHVESMSIAFSSNTVTTEHDVDVDGTTPGTGDLLGISASRNSTEEFSASYQRDSLGRIERLDETVSGVSITRKYEYDGAGRLTRVLDGYA